MMSYFNSSFTVLYRILFVEELRSPYKMEPSAIQQSITIIGLPAVLKFIFGIIADTIHIPGFNQEKPI